MMDVIFFLRPDGRQVTREITNVRDVDAQWFQSSDVAISMEDCGGFFTIYADCGLRVNDDPDEDPDEMIVIPKADESCEDALSRLRGLCEQALSKRAEQGVLS